MRGDVTRNQIADLFLQQVSTIPYSKISVGEISDAVKISRQTFYYYFDNIFNVAAYCIDKEREKRKKYYNLNNLIDKVAEESNTLYNMKDLVTILYNSKDKEKLHEYIFKTLQKMCENHFKDHPSSLSIEDQNFTCDLIAHASTGIIVDWIGEGMPDIFPRISKITRYVANYSQLYGPSSMTIEGDD